MGSPIAPPEPGLTPGEMIARAAAMREELISRRDEVERLTHHPEDIERRFRDAGLYRLYVPRRYGGYEFDPLTFVKVVQELARGDASTAWCFSLAANHALFLGSWWDEQAQDEIFGDGEFRAAAVATPVGMATRRDGGWSLTGKVAYCSGIPYSTHYMGQCLTMEGVPEGGEPRQMLFVAARSEFEIVDDWGNTFGLKGSGSNSIAFDGGLVPEGWALIDSTMMDIDVTDGTPGLALHGNPMYASKSNGVFAFSLAAVLVGACQGALDDLEHILRTRKTFAPPIVERMHDDDDQQWFGAAIAKVGMYEAVTHRAAELHMEYCRRFAEQGRPFTYEDDQHIAMIAREALLGLWDVMANDIFRAAGSSAAVDGSRMTHILRDVSMIAGHGNSRLRERYYRELARLRFGLPLDNARLVKQGS
ncbi:MAG TPA: acyl-CoA dehydrogenase family protein [Solirubrobacteraceae bacterium]|nr:acyl-CoA dehydrogenase family protein [Solirubrobacteraceae bacterium]